MCSFSVYFKQIVLIKTKLKLKIEEKISVRSKIIPKTAHGQWFHSQANPHKTIAFD